jgi:hypothetical protein
MLANYSRRPSKPEIVGLLAPLRGQLSNFVDEFRLVGRIPDFRPFAPESPESPCRNGIPRIEFAETPPALAAGSFGSERIEYADLRLIFSAMGQQNNQTRQNQNCFAIPACLSTALAVCLDSIFPSTGKRRCVIGLYQISWSPLPGRSK